MPTAVTYVLAYIASTAGIAVGSTALIAAGWVITVAFVAGYAASQKRKAMRKARDAFNSSLQDRLVMTSTADGRRSRVYGRVRTVDGVVFKQTHGTHRKFYTLVISLAGHEVDAIETVYFNEVPVTLDSNGYVLTAPWSGPKLSSGQASITVTGGAGNVNLPHEPVGTVTVTMTVGSGEDVGSVSATPVVAGTNVSVTAFPADGTATVNYQYADVVPKARVQMFLGGAAQNLNAMLVALVGSEQLLDTDRFANDATLVATLEYDQDAFPTNVPNITAVVRGAKVLDPRTGVVAWTENPALIARDWALYEHGGNAAAAELNAAAIVAAANACDVVTAFTKADGGVEVRPLYQCGIQIPLDSDVDPWMDEIVEAMAGRWAWAGGLLTMRAGVYRAPVATLDEGWVTSLEAVQIVPQTPTNELVNIVRPTIYDAAQDWVPAPTAPVRFTAAIAADGRELPEEIDMRGVTRAVHAQHIAGVYMRERREGRTVSMSCNLRAWSLELFDVVSVNLPLFGWYGDHFEVLGWGFSVDRGVLLTLRETAAGIYDPATSFDVLTVSPNTALPDPTDVPQVTGVDATSGDSSQLDQSLLVRTAVTWDPVPSQAVRQAGKVEVQWIEASTALPTNGEDWPGRAEAEGNAIGLEVIGLRSGVHYLFRARARTNLGVRGMWSSHHLQLVAATPPATVVHQDTHDFGGTGASGGSYTVRRSVVITPSADCVIEFSASVYANNVYPDAGQNVGWRVTPDGGSTVGLGDGRTSGISTAAVGYSAVNFFEAVGGVELTFELVSRGPSQPITLWESYMRITEVRR